MNSLDSRVCGNDENGSVTFYEFIKTLEGYLFLFFVVLQVPPFSAGSGENKKQDNSASSVYPVGPEERGASAVKYLTRNPSGLMIVD